MPVCAQALPGCAVLRLALISMQYAVLQRCRRVWADNATLLKDVIDGTDEPTILEHNLFIRPPSSFDKGHWGQGSVTLVGDAAHPMRPIAGNIIESQQDKQSCVSSQFCSVFIVQHLWGCCFDCKVTRATLPMQNSNLTGCSKARCWQESL